ncbi:MAG: virulence protein RhuM/Fic/DOC family protein [Minisyncoccia bacterium]
MAEKEPKKGEIVIYKTSKGPELEVKLEKETIWLTQAQIALLFDSERSVITKHLNNIFEEGEIDQKSNVQKMHIANSDKPVAFYSLDVIISVGYRVNSKSATQFRIWATRTLKQHLIQGYTINEKRLLNARAKFAELQSAILFLSEKSKHELLGGQEQEILNLLSIYSKTLTLLEQYDTNKLKTVSGKKAKFVLDYAKSKKIIEDVGVGLASMGGAGDLFGQEYTGKLEAIVKNLYQTYDGKELYDTIEEKAAHLLYLTIKDHPFADGNKRIASFLFVYYLDKNSYLYKETGEKKINDNALVALALLIAVSKPLEKDVMIKIIMNLLV